MRISLNWLKKYVNVPETMSNEELIRLIGARLVEVEGVIDETHKYDNIYIVRVESCEKIPETHLTLCCINAGHVLSRDGSLAPVVTGLAPSSSVVTSGSPRNEHDPALIQVVCGAPNVHEGMLAVWIAPGAVVPASVHEDAPFVIGKRKMRGYESYGMLAGADELDFDDKHEKIAEIDPAIAQPGDKFADVFELNDLILEIENKSLTHRPDCFGIIGFAREVAGILGLSFVGVNDSATSTLRKTTSDCAMSKIPTINISSSELCPRYTAVVMEKHGELKQKYLTWMDTVICKSGMRPVDPIVDATNYLMLLTGQPLHAFDYDKFVKIGGGDKAEIGVRLARKGEKLTLLDEHEVVLVESDIVICSNDKSVALAGAMGGASTAIDAETRNIIIESATFSLYNLRKTQMAHGIFSEAITRFTKGQPVYQTLAVAEECAGMLADGFKVVGVKDEQPVKPKQAVVKITIDEINGLLGTDYDVDQIVKTLTNVGFLVTVSFGHGSLAPVVTGLAPSSSVATSGRSSRKVTQKAQLVTEIPMWRTDVRIKEDIIEEVGRLLGYDNIEPTLPLHGTPKSNPMWSLKHEVRVVLARFGANEVLTYGFVSERLLKKAGQNAKDSYKIVNSISPELQYIRQSLMPSLLDKVYLNEKLPVEKFAIFEMNKVYQKKLGVDAEGVPIEKINLGFAVAERKNNETAFYKAKKYLYELMNKLGIEIVCVPLKEKTSEYNMYEPKRAAEIRLEKDESVLLGIIGEFKNSVKHEFKLAPYVAGFEVDMGLVLEYREPMRKVDLKVRKAEDITVTTDKTYAEVLREVREQHPDAIITPSTIYQAEGQKTRNITLHIEN